LRHAKGRDAVPLIFAEEEVNPDALEPSPGVAQIDPGTGALPASGRTSAERS
jgi:hypothetical protein